MRRTRPAGRVKNNTSTGPQNYPRNELSVLRSEFSGKLAIAPVSENRNTTHNAFRKFLTEDFLRMVSTLGIEVFRSDRSVLHEPIDRQISGNFSCICRGAILW